jgi:hypothetical protein
MALLSGGERALEVYSGATKAWQGMKTGKTASQLMREGALSIIGGEDPLGANFKRAQEGRAKAGEKAIIAILSGIMGVIFIPPFLKKGQ